MIDGSIPAGAGEPSTTEVKWRYWRVYPRGCGGAHHQPSRQSQSAGLSPRVRGSLTGPKGAGKSTGSIPAGAGEPGSSIIGGLFGGVYPRGCGGAPFRRGPLQRGPGLSPRVRGSQVVRAFAIKKPGSIPAGAGEPSCIDMHLVTRGVYPRGCGGASFINHPKSTEQGLSPRVRGSPAVA